MQRGDVVKVAELQLEFCGQAMAVDRSGVALQQAGLVHTSLVAGVQRLESIFDEVMKRLPGRKKGAGVLACSAAQAATPLSRSQL